MWIKKRASDLEGLVYFLYTCWIEKQFCEKKFSLKITIINQQLNILAAVTAQNEFLIFLSFVSFSQQVFLLFIYLFICFL